MKAKLLNPVSSPPEREIDLEQFPVLIGRSPDAGILPADPSVSEWHCEIHELDGRLLVRDLGSECGTFVNGVQIDSAPLLPGDELTVGNSTFIALYAQPGQRPPKAVPSPKEDLHNQDVDGDVDSYHVTFVDLVELLDRQRKIFREHYNREPWQAEPMFPDPPHPEHLEHLIAEEMRIVGVEPQLIHAFETTGILVTVFNYDSISKQQLADWQTAVDEYEDRLGYRNDEQRYPLGTITTYGPDESTTALIVAAVMTNEEAEPIYQHWVANSVGLDPEIKRQITAFFRAHGTGRIRKNERISAAKTVSCVSNLWRASDGRPPGRQPSATASFASAATFAQRSAGFPRQSDSSPA